MQLMCDALSVLGSRHGLLFNPPAKRCSIIRFDRWTELPSVEITAGVVIDGIEFKLPLCSSGGNFLFHDQRLSPCTVSFMGVEPRSAVRLRLDVATPFRPRDPLFSTTPVLALSLSVKQLNDVRWERRDLRLSQVSVFLEINGLDVQARPSSPDSVDLFFNSTRTVTSTVRPSPSTGEDVPRPAGQVRVTALATGLDRTMRSEPLPQHDRLVALSGSLTGTRFFKTLRLDAPPDSDPLRLAWCTFSSPVLQVHGQFCPFLYAERFPSLDAVADWARINANSIFDNAANVNAVVRSSNVSKSILNLMSQTLHSWLINTWWARRPDGRQWFSVWEGNCYFHSTVDVEFTQAPFYLSVWPELLALELDQWPEFAKDGALTLGPAGRRTSFLSHDCGAASAANGQDYQHEMEVEESTNYLIMAYAYWRRTGDDSLLRKHADTIQDFLDFLAAADSESTGVPRLGVANTIDDASPAIQFGRSQTYLAVKALAAFLVGSRIMDFLKRPEKARSYQRLAQLARSTILSKGWVADHFAVLLEKRGDNLIDPITGKSFSLDEVPGWDAAHIYTENALPILDMVGLDLGLDPGRVLADLRTATDRCLREYGCVHTDFDTARLKDLESKGVANASRNPGWISMNMLRDMAAFYRGLDLRHLADRYWDWQTTTNSQQPFVFFETFDGNTLAFYPRGVAVWGYFDALAGAVIDRVARRDSTTPKIPQIRVPRLFDADWKSGTAQLIKS